MKLSNEQNYFAADLAQYPVFMPNFIPFLKF